MVRLRKSRLARKQESRNLKKTVLFSFLSVLLIFLFIFLGIPGLIKLAVFMGNLRSSYLPTETKDTLPPPAPIFQPLPEATLSATLEVKGFAEAGSSVEIFISGLSAEKVISSNDGTFLVRDATLTKGKNEIYAQATDPAGNPSQESQRIVVFFDQEPPPLTILEPTETSFYQPENKVNLKGETEAGVKVTVNDHLVIIDSEGKFSYSLTLSDGENQIKVIATDKAGNQTEQELNLSLK